jgi:hypothetical protein
MFFSFGDLHFCEDVPEEIVGSYSRAKAVFLHLFGDTVEV